METQQTIMNYKKSTQIFFSLGVFFILMILDQATKYLTSGVFKNYNFAFSLPLAGGVMYALYILAFTGITVYLYKNYYQLGWLEQLAWGLIVTGGVSNVGERVILGYVRDWIYIYSGVLNLADGYIILGMSILVLHFNRSDKI